jgi:hypothetical protein
MRKRLSIGWVGMVVLGLATFGFSQTIQINNPPSNNVMDGIYVGSYSATNVSTGASMQIICDDFNDNTGYSAMSYTTNTFSSLGNTLWGSYMMNTQHSSMSQVTQLYDEVVWLSEAMVNLTGTQQGNYSYAIWAIFAPNSVAQWLTWHGDSSACNAVFGAGSWGWGGCSAGKGGLVGLASSQNYSGFNTSNVLILTPTGCSWPGFCGQQEFIEIVAAEGGSSALYLLLALSACFAAIFFRSRRKAEFVQTV